MTRTTGATPEQVDAAVRRRFRQALGYTDMCLLQSNMREIWAPCLVDTEERIVRVDDLRAQRDGLIQFREHYADIVTNNQVNQRDGDCSLEEMDQWKQNGRDGWARKYPELASAIDRIQAAIGEAE